MNSIKLEIERILDDKVDKLDSSLQVRFKKPSVEVWLPADKIPPSLILKYCHRIIQRRVVSRNEINHTVGRMRNLLGVSKKEELDSLLKEFISVTGIDLPSSKKTDIWIALTNLIGKQCDVDDLTNVRRDILIEKIIDKRKAQLVNLRTAERQMNLISDCHKPIKVRNDVDLEEFPSQLRYINETIFYSDSIPKELFVECLCQGTCGASCLHFVEENQFKKTSKKVYKAEKKEEIEEENIQPYDEHGRINYSHKIPIFECNKGCKCDENCPRRVVQKGSNVQLEIFRTFNGLGWGVRTLECVPKGTFVVKYNGELIPWGDGDKRENKEYLFDNDMAIDPVTGRPYFTMDAYKYGNVARFVNHNCQPNLASHLVYINNVDARMGDIVFFAARDIEAFEELNINYIGLVKSSNGKCMCSVCCSC